MRDVWEQMGPLLMLKQERQEGGRGDGKIGGEKETGDVMSDAPEVVRKKSGK